MNAGPTGERVYDALKRELLSGAFRPGERLDPADLAGRVASSVTPVREALHMLVGERLVQTQTGGGFNNRMIDAVDLADLYSWNASVLHLVLRAVRLSPEPVEDTRLDPGRRFARLAERAARATGNSECLATVTRLNDRLAAARRAEELLFDDLVAEIERIVTQAEMLDLRRLISRYHRRRAASSVAIVRAMVRVRV